MKHFLLEEVKEGGASGSNKAEGTDVSKALADGFKNLNDGLAQLNKRIEAQERRATAPVPKKKEPEESDEDLATELLVSPEKAVKKIKEQIKGELESSFTIQNKSKEAFLGRFNELAVEYPELNDTGSEIHKRAKVILAELTDKEWDAKALESAVFRAVTEKGVLPMKHRKQTQVEDEDEEDFLGAGSSRSRSTRRGGKEDKLDPKTKAFAHFVGLNTDDPKVIERLSKTQNERRGNWNKYR